MRLRLADPTQQLWGHFHTPPAGDYNAMYSSANFNNDIKRLFDITKAMGGNAISMFGCIDPMYNGSGLTRAVYHNLWRNNLGYGQKLGMYVIPYMGPHPGSWSSATFAQGRAELVALIQVLAQFDCVPTVALCDEAFGGGTDETMAVKMDLMYADCKGVIPANLPICATSNPSGNSASSAGNACAVNAVLARCINTCDVLIYNNQHTTDDLVALHAAHPTREIVCGATTCVGGDDAAFAAVDNGVSANIGAGIGVRTALHFTHEDFPGGSGFGFYSGAAPAGVRARRANFVSHVPAAVALNPRRRIFDAGMSPRANKKLRWGL